ncbi:MAG: hypothetical protein AAGC60_03330 [Acidobacteriota bacterium]
MISLASSPSPARRGPALTAVPLLVALALLLIMAPASLAQQPAEDAGDPTIVLERQGRTQVRLAYPASEIDGSLSGDTLQAAREIEQTLRDDLDQTRLFNTMGPTELSVLVLTGDRAQDFDQYRSLGNEVVLYTEIQRDGDKLVLDAWVYDLPSRQSILGKRYRGTLDQARLLAHYLTDALHFQFSGRPSLALTTIAFQSERGGHRELYLMDYDGYNQRAISAHKSTTGYPDWSPTGDAVAYMSYFSGTPGIYYVDLESGQKIPIYRDGVLNLSPTFSPDGRRVAFASNVGANTDIFLCERACTQPRRITTTGAIDTNPSWSPRGDKIAFTSSRSGRPNLYVMDADGSNVRRISFEGDYNDGASWRPDGTEIAYASRKNNRFRIAITNLVDLETRIVAQGPESYEEPSFSPDGSKLAYTVRRGQESQVFVMNADGSDVRQLTHEGNSSAPDWSPHPQR